MADLHLRAWDLLRQMRNELLDAGLIDLHEYAWMVAESPAADPRPGMGSTAPRRLETYDAMRARIDELESDVATLGKNLHDANDMLNALGAARQRIGGLKCDVGVGPVDQRVAGGHWNAAIDMALAELDLSTE